MAATGRRKSGPRCARPLQRFPLTVHKLFVVMHWPLCVSYPDEEDSYFHMPNRYDIIDFFVEQRVSCVLAGHLHQGC